ncbi:MAG TPA: hypothetical protein VKI65_06310 [Gemmataceae bacterium]|nr:hypothetical protein [Gemmataceae bacterium]
MWTTKCVIVSSIFLSLSGRAALAAEPKAVRDIGSRLELFVDDWLIDRMQGVSLQLHHPTSRNVALRFDAPWEGAGSAYVTVMKDGDKYRMYYRGLGGAKDPELTCYAESGDGVHWTKPKLGIVEFKGSKENNIILAGSGNLSHNFAPFKDANPAAPPEQRYKAMTGAPMHAYASADGIHWKPLADKPVITKGAFDSQNLAFWDTVRGRYVAFFRGFRDGKRDILTCSSTDFLHWTEPVYLDFGNAPREHFYTNAITAYFRAPHLLLGFPKRFVPERKIVTEQPETGVSDAVFLSSRDGLRFDRRFREAFIRPGLDRLNWMHRSNMTAWGVVPTGPGEISIYYSEHYDTPKNQMRRATLRTDGFASVNAPAAGGEFVTKALTFQGKELAINYGTSAAGSVRVEIQGADGKSASGFSLADCPGIYGDEIERVVTWKGGKDLSALAGQTVRLRFVMNDADLYSIRFRR